MRHRVRGSEMHGREEIERTLSDVFADHETASHVAKIRDVRSLGETAELRGLLKN